MKGRHPTRADLDEAVPNRPAVLYHTSLHACVLNTAALKEAGFEEGQPDPAGGAFGRDRQGQARRRGVRRPDVRAVRAQPPARPHPHGRRPARHSRRERGTVLRRARRDLGLRCGYAPQDARRLRRGGRGRGPPAADLRAGRPRGGGLAGGVRPAGPPLRPAGRRGREDLVRRRDEQPDRGDPRHLPGPAVRLGHLVLRPRRADRDGPRSRCAGIPGLHPLAGRPGDRDRPRRLRHGPGRAPRATPAGTASSTAARCTRR